MTKDVLEYFDSKIMPLLKNQYSSILKDMNILILGSVGLGIDDELSDMEAVIYLPQETWKQYGANLQLSLNKCVAETNLWTPEGSIICVHPFSWLLDGQGEKIICNSDPISWEEISIESLYTIQENLIYYDPQENLKKLRNMTASKKMPKNLYKKLLLLGLKDFVENSFYDLVLSIKRNKIVEAYIHLGRAIENLFRIGFYICHQYYPWRTHLHWAFRKLPLPLSQLSSKFDLLTTTTDWSEKVNILETIYNLYKEYIISNSIFPEIDLDKEDIYSHDLHNELIWAERLNAWDNPNWRGFINERSEKAVKNGYSSDQFWVWSLWGIE